MFNLPYITKSTVIITDITVVTTSSIIICNCHQYIVQFLRLNSRVAKLRLKLKTSSEPKKVIICMMIMCIRKRRENAPGHTQLPICQKT